MKGRISILNLATALFLLGCIIYTCINYDVLSEGEGWGVVFMIGLFFMGTTAFIVDVVIRNFVKNIYLQNVAGIIVILVYFLVFYFGM